MIASVIRDPARTEELAVEVFLKWSRTPTAPGENVEGRLYRTAVRVGQNELRRQIRRSRYEKLFGFVRGTPTPEELLVVRQEQQRVDLVLSVLEPRQTELLVLRSYGFSYDELASTLDLNPSSVGTFLSRVQQAFRKEVIAGCGGVAAGISGDHLIHTLNLPKHSLHTPKKTLRQARQADPL